MARVGQGEPVNSSNRPLVGLHHRDSAGAHVHRRRRLSRKIRGSPGTGRAASAIQAYLLVHAVIASLKEASVISDGKALHLMEAAQRKAGMLDLLH